MGKSQKATTTQTPWGPAQGALQNVLGDASALYSQGGFETPAYQGHRVASFSPQTQSALTAMGQASPMTGQAQDAWAQMMAAGPADIAGLKQTVTGDVNAALGSRFGGQMGNSLVQQSFARGVGDALAPIEYGAYNDLMNRRMQGISMAPALQGMGMQDNAAALQAGGIQDDLAQRQINANMQAFQDDSGAKKNALIEYSNMVRGIGGMGGSGTTTQPGNPLQSLGAGVFGGLQGYGAAMGMGMGPLALPLGILSGLARL